MVVGKKSAILVGCHYYDTQSPIYGCDNDLKTIQDILHNSFSFDRIKDIRTLIDTEPHSSPNYPTKVNIDRAFQKMKNEAGKGDILFFYFSGMAKLVPPDDSPAIFSCDLEPFTAGYFRSLFNPLPDNATFTFVCESSHSGNFLEPVGADNSILLSACKADEIADRVVPDGGDKLKTYGKFTHAINTVLISNPPPIKNIYLHTKVKELVDKQNPCLRCTEDTEKENFLDHKIEASK